MKKYALPSLALLICGTAAAVDEHLYRDGEAPVIERTAVPAASAPSADQILDDARRSFGAAYRAAGQPRIVVYWNRALSDDIEQRKEHSLRMTDLVEATPYGVVRDVELVGTTRTVDRGARGRRVNPARDAQMQSAFLAQLQSAGARLVDRTMILRNAHLDGAHSGHATDVLATEGKALHGHADILLEVSLLHDAQAPEAGGYTGFRVLARRIGDGGQVLTHYTRAEPIPPEEPPPRWQAGRRGFEKVRVVEDPPPLVAEDLARQLSAEILEQLARGLAASGGAPR